MKCNLFINYYTDKSSARQAELDTCIEKNLLNKSINNVVMLCTLDEIGEIKRKFVKHMDKVVPVIMGKRPTYNDFFYLTRYFEGPENLNIIANTDIIIPPETVKRAPLYLKNMSTCLALSRWDVGQIMSYEFDSIHFNRDNSQDTWIFLGYIGHTDGADFSLGVAGCDNRIAYLLHERGYNVLNPSKSLKTYHFHNSGVRNYVEAGRPIHVIPPPYKLLPPTE